MSTIRHEVLRAFKKLHRTRQLIFQGDNRALTECRRQINEKFRENRNASGDEEIKKMITLAQDVEKELRTSVVQAVQKEDNVYELRINPDTLRLDNIMFNPSAEIERPRRRPKAGAVDGCCSGTSGNAKQNSDLKK